MRELNIENNMQLSKNFDSKYYKSGIYRNYKNLLAEWVSPVAKKIARFIKKPQAKILDVGCAHGYLIAELQDEYNFIVRGIDYSSYAVRSAIPSVRGKIRQGNILNLPFRNNIFDAVICLDVVNYLTTNEIKKAIANLIKVSKKYIFFCAIFRRSSWASQKINPDKFRISVLSKKEYVDIFNQKGAGLIKNFQAENGGQILVFEKRPLF